MTNSFNPSKFLEIAKKLADDSKYDPDGRWRTAIGRAYYAAFLNALLKLEQAGFKIKNVGEIHKEVIEKISDEGFTRTSNKLEKLRKMRIIADYDLKETLTILQCQNSFKLSEIIITEIKNFY
ncbi:MAG TPA: HEPN domain-containing protein [Candidatus Deferrimicrobium sp.]|nr:HEPN domain-containing protein [Candidatus Deferrimicrobium sp.]